MSKSLQIPKIFVSAAFTGKTWEQVIKERESLHALANTFNLEIVEQFIGYEGKEDFENPDYNPSFILAKDKNFIKDADAFVIDLSQISLGAACELTIAKELFDKKTYAVIPDKARKKHPWVRFYCDYIFDTFEETFQKIKEDFSGKLRFRDINRMQYDPIAIEYKLVEQTPAQIYIYDPAVISALKKHAKEDYTIVLHGGSGYRARLAKKIGVAKVASFDISYKQTQIARMEELQNPMGIEFFNLDPYSKDFLSTIPSNLIGNTDVVLGAFLLDHAMNIDELTIVTQNIYKLLSKNAVFFALLDHPNIHVPTDPKYGVGISFDEGVIPDSDGAPRRISIYQSLFNNFKEVLHFYNFRWGKETLSKTLLQAGFSSVDFTEPNVSEEGIKKYGNEYWKSYNNQPSILAITAKK